MELLSTQQAAKQLGVTPGTLMVWRCTKRYPLAFIKVGRKVRYTQEAIARFLQARTVPGDGSGAAKRRRKAA